jgi:hypothetical protein
MQLLARIGRGWPLAALAVLGLLWVGLSGLLVVTRGKPEAFLTTTFGRSSRADAFEHLNGVSTLVWSVHSLLVLTAIAATRYRRTDVLAVLIIGPAIAASIALLGQQWADPNWFEVVAVCAIGSVAGTVVGSAYWVLMPREARRQNSLDQGRPTA